MARALLPAKGALRHDNQGSIPKRLISSMISPSLLLNMPSEDGLAGEGARSTSHFATTFSISAFSRSYGTAPGWYQATLPARSSNTSVGVVEAPYVSKL